MNKRTSTHEPQLSITTPSSWPGWGLECGSTAKSKFTLQLGSFLSTTAWRNARSSNRHCEATLFHLTHLFSHHSWTRSRDTLKTEGRVNIPFFQQGTTVSDLRGADCHPDHFTLSCKPPQCLLEQFRRPQTRNSPHHRCALRFCPWTSQTGSETSENPGTVQHPLLLAFGSAPFVLSTQAQQEENHFVFCKKKKY